MPILSNCCFFLDLKVGTKIIGILTLIAGLINTLVFAGMVALFVFIGFGTKTTSSILDSLPAAIEDYEDDYIDARNAQAKNMLEIISDHIAAVTIILYVLLALSLMSVITSSMLIHGVKRNRRGLLLPYLVQEAVNVIVLISLDIWAMAVLGTSMPVVSTVLALLGAALIHLYFALVVLSQYQALGLIRMHEEISMK